MSCRCIVCRECACVCVLAGYSASVSLTIRQLFSVDQIEKNSLAHSQNSQNSSHNNNWHTNLPIGKYNTRTQTHTHTYKTHSRSPIHHLLTLSHTAIDVETGRRFTAWKLARLCRPLQSLSKFRRSRQHRPQRNRARAFMFKTTTTTSTSQSLPARSCVLLLRYKLGSIGE